MELSAEDDANLIQGMVLAAGAAFSDEIREAIISRLVRARERGARDTELIDLMREAMAEFLDPFSELLADARLTSWLAGGAQIAALLPSLPGPAPSFIQHEKSDGAGEVMVWVNPRALDQAWQLDTGYYLPPEGTLGASEIKGRRAGFRRFLETGEAIQAPRVSLNRETGAVEFEDGRHRFAVLRDEGVTAIPIMVPANEAAEFQSRFGTTEPADQLPEAEAWEWDGNPEFLPIIQAAAEDLQARQLVFRDEWDQMNAEMRQESFTAAMAQTEEALDTIRAALVEAIGTGSTLEEFEAAITEAVDHSSIGPGLIETTFRTAVASAYNSGYEDILNNPIVSDEFPFERTVGIEDSRQSELCETVNSAGLEDTGIFYREDPEWQRLKPPRHWNCRCSRIPMTVEMAADHGVKYAIEWLESGIQPAYVNMPRINVELPKGWITEPV